MQDMKLSLEPQKDIVTITTTEPNTKPIINSEIHKDIDKLSVKGNVIVSNTMIKITYNKALKDQNDSSNDSDFTSSKKITTVPNLNNISLSPTVQLEKLKHPIFHSTPNVTDKKIFINGLNLATKANPDEYASESNGSSSSSKVEKCSSISSKNVGNEKSEECTGLDEQSKGIKRKASTSDEEDEVDSKKVKSSYEGNESSTVNSLNQSGKKQIMYVDPLLPEGWSRYIREKYKGDTFQEHVVYLVNPEGKRFRYKWKLKKYLKKHKLPFKADQFFFGLYERKPTIQVKLKEGGGEEESSGGEDAPDASERSKSKASAQRLSGCKSSEESENEEETRPKGVNKKPSAPPPRPKPMYVDPNLPKGWKRFIKTRTIGESAGRMEVFIISPDGRRHRSRKNLEHYLLQNKLKYNIDDFDFTVFGKAYYQKLPNSKKPPPKVDRILSSDSFETPWAGIKKKFKDQPVPDLDFEALKEPVITPEGRLIETVTGLMMCSELTTIRNERRARMSRKDLEQQLQKYLNSEENVSFDNCDIPPEWVQRLLKCRPDFKPVEPEAVLNIGDAVKGFIQKLSVEALKSSDKPEEGLRYEDLARFVDEQEGLSYLKTLIPKKITFRKFITLNRPKHFMSFT